VSQAIKKNHIGQPDPWRYMHYIPVRNHSPSNTSSHPRRPKY